MSADPHSGHLGEPQARDQRQAQIGEWAIACFSEKEAKSLPQRGLRLLEEAAEAAQACGLDVHLAHSVVSYVYGRPAGSISQELGGVGVTLLALAEAARLSAEDCEVAEVLRVLSKPQGHFAERNRQKNQAGLAAIPMGGQAMTDLGESKAVPERFKTCDEESRSLATRIGTKCMLDDGFFDTTRAAAHILPKLLQYAAKVRDLEEQLAVAKAGSIFTELLDEMDEEAENDPEFNDRIAAENDAMVEKAESTLAQQESTIREQAQTIERLTKALERLANEASGFKSMAVPFWHGRTNMAVLGLRIDEARAELADRRAAIQKGAEPK